MSNQFTCVACGKNIEIDNQWAMRLVECPYCHDTVRAPGMSTLRAEEPPLASPVSPGFYPEHSPPMSAGVVVGAGPVAGSRNAMAFVGLGLGCLAFMLLLGLSSLMYVKILEPLGTNNPTQEQVMQAMKAAADAQEPWVMQLAMVSFCFFGVWLAAIVCSIIAVTRRGRRPLAIAALAVSLLPLISMLIGL